MRSPVYFKSNGRITFMIIIVVLLITIIITIIIKAVLWVLRPFIFFTHF